MAIVAPSLVVIVVSNRLVAMSRRSIVMHCRSGLVHVTVSIEAIVLVAVSTLVGPEYLRTVIVEMAPVVVRGATAFTFLGRFIILVNHP